MNLSNLFRKKPLSFVIVRLVTPEGLLLESAYPSGNVLGAVLVSNLIYSELRGAKLTDDTVGASGALNNSFYLFKTNNATKAAKVISESLTRAGLASFLRIYRFVPGKPEMPCLYPPNGAALSIREYNMEEARACYDTDEYLRKQNAICVGLRTLLQPKGNEPIS